MVSFGIVPLPGNRELAKGDTVLHTSERERECEVYSCNQEGWISGELPTVRPVPPPDRR